MNNKSFKLYNTGSVSAAFLSEGRGNWRGFPGGSDGKESDSSVGDSGSNPGLGRSPGGGNGNPLQNSTDRGAWWATVHGVAQSQT